MKRDESGIGCGARGQETNAPPALGRRRGTARGHYGPPRGARWRRAVSSAWGSTVRLPKRGRAREPKAGRNGTQEARPGAAKTLRWRAERRHTFARRC